MTQYAVLFDLSYLFNEKKQIENKWCEFHFKEYLNEKAHAFS